ncbi:MAG: DsbA family oxidoreductase [Raineya sp.]|jgi:predicted DsbA family dithiol-disulfide isomerase|nr:DsbA family oxidoreductase [Raineya sp.]
MEVEIWSDVLCPFCYIGKRKFEKALQSFEHQNDIKVTWKSFQLDPDFENNTLNTEYSSYLETRKGWSKAQTQQILANVTQMAKDAGLDFHFESAIVANSYEAHRLLHFAKEENLQNKLKEVLLEAHFVKGFNIGDKNVLAELGKNIGLSDIIIERFMNSQEQSEEVQKDIYEAFQIGVKGVPFFVFDRKFAISGAQDSSVFLKALQQSFVESADQSADICDIDGNC